jgi:hypothetical protein
MLEFFTICCSMLTSALIGLIYSEWATRRATRVVQKFVPKVAAANQLSSTVYTCKNCSTVETCSTRSLSGLGMAAYRLHLEQQRARVAHEAGLCRICHGRSTERAVVLEKLADVDGIPRIVVLRAATLTTPESSVIATLSQACEEVASLDPVVSEIVEQFLADGSELDFKTLVDAATLLSRD